MDEWDDVPVERLSYPELSSPKKETCYPQNSRVNLAEFAAGGSTSPLSQTAILARLDDVVDRLDRLCELVERGALAVRRSPRRASERSSPSRAIDRARSYIEAQLREGPKTWEQLVNGGARFNHSARTMMRARAKVATCRRVGDRWFWYARERR